MTDSSSRKDVSLAINAIDGSCRAPLFVMFISAAVWLLISSVFGIISTLKFHEPNLLADCPWLTYGRVRPAYLNAIIYGFCLQAGLGTALWIIARLGRAVTGSVTTTIGAALLNLGVTIGIAGILAGDSTGFQNLDFPGYAALIIFLGYLLIGIQIALTFHLRRERALFVSQWFLVTALFWFPWIYSTAYLLLVSFPVRGVAQPIVAWWFSGNLLSVWLGLVGLATIFYFIPKLTSVELHSRYLALLTFWFLIIFGSWSGIPGTAPVPAWLPTLSMVATVLTLLTLITVALNIYETLKQRNVAAEAPVSFQFIRLGVAGFFVAGLLNILSVLPEVRDLVSFTWFTVAREHATFYGFFSLVMFGAIYYIFPLVSGLEFHSAKLVRAHLWLAGVGIFLVVVPLAIGGLVQGAKLRNPDIAFMDISKATLPFLRASTMGDLLIAIGHGIFVVNLLGVVTRFSQPRARAGYVAATADIFDTAEVKS